MVGPSACCERGANRRHGKAAEETAGGFMASVLSVGLAVFGVNMENQLILHILRNPYGWGEKQIREARHAAADLIESLERALEFEKRKKLSRGFVGYGLFNDGKLVTCSQQEVAISIGRNAIECLPLYVERDETANPYFYTLCTTEKLFHKTLKQMELPRADWPAFMKTGRANATLHAYENDGKLLAVLCFPVNKKIERNQIVALLAHEAQHLWRWAREELGEAHPSSEFEAYAIQSILQCWLYEYDRQTKKGKK